ncbi:hypothetical protein V8F33_001445 [Rhypophila sp. PSN 637]
MVAMVPTALQVTKVPFKLNKMSVKLSGANMNSSDPSGALLLLAALHYLRPRTFLFNGTGSEVLGATKDPHNRFFAICLLQPSLRRVDFHRRSCFQDGIDWLYTTEAPISQNCTRVRMDEPPPRLYNDNDVVPTPKRGHIQAKRSTRRPASSPGKLDEFALSDVLLISPDRAEQMPDLGGLLREIHNYSTATCEDHDLEWKQQNLTGLLVAETLQWEKVLDVLREGKKFGSGNKDASSLPLPLRLCGLGIDKVLHMKCYKLYYLINAFAKIWISNQRHGTAGNNGGNSGGDVKCEWDSEPMWNPAGAEQFKDIAGDEMNAAEEYVMHLRDVNPIAQFRANLLLLSKSRDKEGMDDEENDDDEDEIKDEEQDEDQDQDEDEDAEDEDAENEDNDDDDRVFVAGVYIGTRQELLPVWHLTY